jgi:hypothetical protein
MQVIGCVFAGLLCGSAGLRAAVKLDPNSRAKEDLKRVK